MVLGDYELKECILSRHKRILVLYRETYEIYRGSNEYYGIMSHLQYVYQQYDMTNPLILFFHSDLYKSCLCC